MNFKFLSVIPALLLFSLTSFAAPKPLNSPQGLALDSKGNLYVANNGGNQILIYGPAYTQQTARTIAKSVSSPSSVVVDALGNIWVANLSGGPSGTGTLTEYSTAGVLTNTFTDGIDYPYALATDGIGEIWVENNFNSVVVYPSYGGAPIKTFSFTEPVTGLATHNMWIAIGGNTSTQLWEIGNYLAGAYPVFGVQPSGAYSLAWDSAGNTYFGTIQNTLNVANAATNITSQLVSLGYFPFGIAVDHARGRVYVSDANHNQINVYNAATGALLHTIQ
jgi:sugar lactone lactonase YvrE